MRLLLLTLTLAACTGDSKTGTDADGDGYVFGEDCDDWSPAVHPGADERCDGADNDCNGFIDDDAVDGADWYADADGDGFGTGPASRACEGIGAVAARDGDCDDVDPNTFPGAAETCDGVDEDCDEEVDEDAEDAATWHADADGDGFGDVAEPLDACDEPDGYVADDTDCDDANAEVLPSGTEACNDVDDDCDGSVDEDDAIDLTSYYADADGDGFGDAAAPLAACEAPDGYVADGTDCDDADATVFPGADEYCDGVDDDCDEVVDDDPVGPGSWYADGDGDGYGDDTTLILTCEPPADYIATGGDCDDADATANPAGTEICDDADDDCDGTVDDSAIDASTFYIDDDGDGFGDGSIVACDAPTGSSWVDGDCDDTSASVYPGATETCDGVDEDCDGTADNDAIDAPSWYADADSDGYGDDASATVACTAPGGAIADGGDCDDSDAAVSPDEAEVCDDGVDNDCDGGAGSCALSGELALTDADIAIEYTAASYRNFAETLAVGDVDDDGVDEIVVGCSLGNGSYGLLNVYRGTPGAYVETDAWLQMSAVDIGTRFGDSALVADLTDDGVADLLVGATVSSAGASYGGEVYLFEGPLTGAETAATATLSVVGALDEQAGETLASGDLDGDGVADLVIGSRDAEDVWVVRGPLTADTTTTAAWANVTDSGLGAVVAVGDLDGDGVDDLVNGLSSVGVSYGLVYVHYGLPAGTSDLSATADATIRGESYDSFGAALAVGGDLDGDGLVDLVVGAPARNSDSGDTDNGAVHVFQHVVTGSVNATDEYDLRVLGTAEYDALGSSVDTRGDLDGNGVPDLLAGASGEAGISPYGAGVAVYYDLDDDTPDFTVTHGYHSDSLGSVVRPGDLDGDGNTDVVAAAEDDPYYTGTDWWYGSGAVYAFFGSGL